jgi:hypothetical protein
MIGNAPHIKDQHKLVAAEARNGYHPSSALRLAALPLL